MDRIKTILLLLLCSVLFAACRNDAPDNKAQVSGGERLSVDMRFLNGVGALQDEQIHSVRVIVLSKKGELVFNDLTPIISGTGPEVTVKAQVIRGSNNIYVVCNETPELGTKLAAIKREGEIENTVLAASRLSAPIPMYGKVLQARVQANADGTNVTVTVADVTTDQLSVVVDRLVAKLSLTAIKNITEAQSDFTVEQMKYRVYRMPKTTPLGAGRPYHGDWVESPSVVGIGQLTNNGSFTPSGDRYTVGAGVDQITFADLYVAEHLLPDPADTSQASYLLIEAFCRPKNGGSTGFWTTYTLPIGQNPESGNNNLTRNHQYHIYATIRGLGKGSAIYLEAQWNEVEVSGDVVVPYLNVSELSPTVVFPKDPSGTIVFGDQLKQSYYFWSNVSPDKISIERMAMADNPLVGDPVLTITKNSVTADGVPDVAGRIDVELDRAFVERTFHVSNRTPHLLGVAIKSDQLSRSLGVVLKGSITPQYAITPESGSITVTKDGWGTWVSTTSTATVSALSLSDNLTLVVTQYRYMRFTYTPTGKTANPDGTYSYQWEITFTASDPAAISAFSGAIGISFNAGNIKENELIFPYTVIK